MLLPMVPWDFTERLYNQETSQPSLDLKSNEKLYKFLVSIHEGLQATGNQENCKYLVRPVIQLPQHRFTLCHT